MQKKTVYQVSCKHGLFTGKKEDIDSIKGLHRKYYKCKCKLDVSSFTVCSGTGLINHPDAEPGYDG